MRQGAIVAVGTAKGIFLVTGEGTQGPHSRGDRVPSLAIDSRHGPPRMLAGAVSDRWGPVVRISDDLGRTWTDPAERTIQFPTEAGASLAQVWQIHPGHADEPDVILAGVEPAALFRSEDRGETWTLNDALWDHPDRKTWEPGFGGLGLHSILIDPGNPERVHIAISAGGVYRTDDGGSTWTARNQGIIAAGMPEEFPESGQCVHKIARDAADPDRLYARNHYRLYRSDDRGDAWIDVTKGVPWDFGFGMVTHPRRGGTVYVIPLESDEYRCTPDGRCRVYRTDDAGESWEPLSTGLPQEGAHLTVLRDAFCHDGGDPLGLYFGTRTGQVFASSDEGEGWELLADYLPPVLCVRAAIVT